jgi:hypothetical protein
LGASVAEGLAVVEVEKWTDLLLRKTKIPVLFVSKVKLF